MSCRRRRVGGLAGLLLVAAVGRVGATAPEPAAGDSPEQLMALMEFVGGWEKRDGEWIDAMSLDESAPRTESDDDHEQDTEN